MAVKKPHVGLVIGYDYLWAKNNQAGIDTVEKNRPCCIVSAVQPQNDGNYVVLVLPITHTPQNPEEALKIPPQVEKILDLDGWVVCSEVNKFIWPPGNDAENQHGTITRGFLKAIKTRVQTMRDGNVLRVVSRSN